MILSSFCPRGENCSRDEFNLFFAQFFEQRKKIKIH